MKNQADKPKAIVFLDYSNLYYGMQRVGWGIDFLKLKDFLNEDYRVVDFYYYAREHFSSRLKKVANRTFNINSLRGKIEYVKKEPQRGDMLNLVAEYRGHRI